MFRNRSPLNDLRNLYLAAPALPMNANDLWRRIGRSWFPCDLSDKPTLRPCELSPLVNLSASCDYFTHRARFGKWTTCGSGDGEDIMDVVSGGPLKWLIFVIGCGNLPQSRCRKSNRRLMPVQRHKW